MLGNKKFFAFDTLPIDGTKTIGVFTHPTGLRFDDEADFPWISYTSLLSTQEELEKQKKNLFDTGLRLGTTTLKFLYNNQIAFLEELVQKEYDKLEVVEHLVKLEEEIFYTMKIEGAKTTLARTHALRNGAPIDKNNEYSETMVKNGFDAVKYLNLYTGKFNEEILLELWRILGNGVCDGLWIMGEKWRVAPVFIGEYEAIPFEQVPAAMATFIDFYNKSILSENAWLKALLLHFAFEYVHPFSDCNGRTGRMIMNKFLIDSGFDKIRAVSFTSQFDKERARYDVAFIDSENEILDCTPFLLFGLEALYRAMHSCNS